MLAGSLTPGLPHPPSEGVCGRSIYNTAGELVPVYYSSGNKAELVGVSGGAESVKPARVVLSGLSGWSGDIVWDGYCCLVM